MQTSISDGKIEKYVNTLQGFGRLAAVLLGIALLGIATWFVVELFDICLLLIKSPAELGLVSAIQSGLTQIEGEALLYQTRDGVISEFVFAPVVSWAGIAIIGMLFLSALSSLVGGVIKTGMYLIIQKESSDDRAVAEPRQADARKPSVDAVGGRQTI